jgi:ABC-type Fe3+/spermidine/putrescine transport system ATPase subunit
VSKLVLRNVSRAFGEVAAVQDFSLAVAEGEFVALLGPSGCGKTTTLRMIAGFLAPSAGAIELDGKVISSPGSSLPPESRQMSMIFQSYAIWPNMTVAENVGFGLKIRKLAAAEIRRRVDEILEVVQLGALRSRYPAELSGGQQQRVALARAIVVKPAVLLLDEPLSNLDANLREEMRFEIRRLHDAFRITTLYVTHDQAEAMVTSDRIVVMSKGRIEQVDAPFALYGRPRTRFVAGFIGRTNFVEGRLDGDAVQFPGFRIPQQALRAQGPLADPVLVSIRPQSLRLAREAQAPGNGGCSVQGRVSLRAYLGEYWDYQVEIDGASKSLRVTTRPQEVFDVGERVRVELDVPQLVVINKD